MKKLFYFILMGGVLSLSSCAKKAETDNKEVAEDQNKEVFEDSDVKKDAQFAVDAADAGMFEVMMGQIAASNAVNPEVKKLGQMMVDEHTKANDELKNAAAQKNITLPVGLSDKKQKKYDDLSAKTGHDFDKAYTDAMVDGHKDVIDLFKKESEKGNDADLKAWASGKLPTLEHHLATSEAAQKMVKESKN